MISLFSDDKPIQANKKKQKKNTPIIQKQVITDELEIKDKTNDIQTYELETEPINTTTSDIRIYESEKEHIASSTSDTIDSATSLIDKE